MTVAANSTVTIKDPNSAYFNFIGTVTEVRHFEKNGSVAWVEVPSGTGDASIGMAVRLTQMEEVTSLEGLKTQLTLKFAGGRRPADKEMPAIESLRDQISTMEYNARKDVSWCKS